MLTIVVDENIPAADACFGTLGRVVRKAGRHLQPEDVRDADVLVVRSITQVNEALLAGSKVRFVGTATIGVDHVDQAYLHRQGIGFSNAPGCNAQSVVDYVLTALLELEAGGDFSLQGKTLGIVGLGNVGSRLKGAAERLGLKVLACDPPLQRQGVTGLVSPEAVWQADLVSLHVPITRDGEFPTWHLVDAKRLRAMAPGAVLINTARGAVVDNAALLQVLNERTDLRVVLDVWEGEPLINPALLAKVDIASPHIAGYSHDGKVRGTHMIYRALCEFLRQPAPLQEQDLIDAGLAVALDFLDGQANVPTRACDVIRQVYAIAEDDRALRASVQQANPGEAFDRLRKQYRVRREFATVRLLNSGFLQRQLPPTEWQRLQALGFRCE